jgi:hypothetical protein
VADNSGMIKIAAIGGAAFLAYRQGWLSFLGIGTPATAVSPATGTPVTAVPSSVAPAASPVPSLDSVYGSLVQQVGPLNSDHTMGPDGYNALLIQIYPAAAPLPDPVSLFSGTDWARPAAMPIASYWSRMAPWLQQNRGFAGLGIYGTLGALAMQQRGW